MEDFYLSDTIEDNTIFVSPLSHKMYLSAGGKGLGGSEGFFVCSERSSNPDAGMEILAKASTMEAAELIFCALISKLRAQAA
jgi:hypothetical protein|tara:strand:+ start:2129 stop:2374 length:246 start_codon:yes stop_codon:yes gene_type:complete